MTQVVGHFLVFSVVAVLFLVAPLILGMLVRPTLPTAEKDSVYECGEPTIGTSYIQFDLRFYVVALLFIVFDVEVVFFFPWARVFGTAMQLADTGLSETARTTLSEQLTGQAGAVIDAAGAYQLGLAGAVDLAVFFAVLLVGFAYLWKRGDLDWVRTIGQSQKIARAATSPVSR